MNLESKILLVTGEHAKNLVSKYASSVEVKTEVRTLPISIASFMKLPLVLDELKEINPEEYSMILVPGLANFDLQEAEDKLDVPVFKGPKYAADLPIVLSNIKELDLSKTDPACEFLEEETSKHAKERIAKIEEKARREYDEEKNIVIGEGEKAVFSGVDFPPRVVAEIEDASRKTDEEIVDIAKKYVENGAEIIDIGMPAESENSEEIPRIISVLRNHFELPISIDTTNESEIETAIDHDIDLIISIDGSTIENFSGLETPTVLIPRNPKNSYHPQDPLEKVDYLNKLLEKADQLDYQNVIADPILDPVGHGFYNSLIAFYKLRERNPNIPIFMGIGNVMELYDADSVGMTALMMGLVAEIGVNFALIVEASDKTEGSVGEAVKARDMMILAEERDSVPKDLGLDLLKLKEKRKSLIPYDSSIEKDAVLIEAESKEDFPMDPKGYFKIFVQDEAIIAVQYVNGEPKSVIKGESADEICNEIVRRNLISKLSHATYLGRELQKAETALRTGRGYVQEADLFEG